jgi:hypothetical protein
MKATLLLTTIMVSAFGVRSMVNGNCILLIRIMVGVKQTSSSQTFTAQLEQKTTTHQPFVIQRLYPAARIKSDCEEALQIAAQGDEAAMDKMIEQDRITFLRQELEYIP